MEVADRAMVMSEGNIKQVGTLKEIWHTPENRFVLEFLSEVSRLVWGIRSA